MTAIRNVIGKRFGRLLVLHRDESRVGVYWICQCTCGTIKSVQSGNLGKCIFSCGCLSKDNFKEYLTKHGMAYKIPEYDVWKRMRSRCRNKNNPRWMDYGGRGISVCPSWTNFSVFLRDMGRRPSDKHSLERRNNNGNYEPKNCFWATSKQQARNKRNVPLFKYRGKSRCLSEWAEILGVSRLRLFKRLQRGWSVKKSFETP